MKTISNHPKVITYFLAMLVLFQSCIVINKKSTVKKASDPEIERIKIRTIEGKKYTLDWIDRRDGNVVSIRNTERIIIDKEKVKQIVISDPFPRVMPLDSITRYSGNISFVINDRRDKIESQEFIQFEDMGDSYKCYKMISEDTVTVVIPLEQIEKISVPDHGASKVVSFMLGSAIFVGIMVVMLAQSDWYY